MARPVSCSSWSGLQCVAVRPVPLATDRARTPWMHPCPHTIPKWLHGQTLAFRQWKAHAGKMKWTILHLTWSQRLDIVRAGKKKVAQMHVGMRWTRVACMRVRWHLHGLVEDKRADTHLGVLLPWGPGGILALLAGCNGAVCTLPLWPLGPTFGA